MSNKDPIKNLVTLLTRLPGIGKKTATRLAYHFLSFPHEYVHSLSQALLDLTHNVKTCSFCCNYTREDPCELCEDPRRDERQICVVARPQDLTAIESTSQYRGKYHVLHGVLSPLDGIGPEDLRFNELMKRIRPDRVEEIILAISPSVEGEATSLYLAQMLNPMNVKVTRIAAGVPMGGELEYSDGITLGRALEDRREIRFSGLL